jgi:hypothetical protein
MSERSSTHGTSSERIEKTPRGAAYSAPQQNHGKYFGLEHNALWGRDSRADGHVPRRLPMRVLFVVNRYETISEAVVSGYPINPALRLTRSRRSGRSLASTRWKVT